MRDGWTLKRMLTSDFLYQMLCRSIHLLIDFHFRILKEIRKYSDNPNITVYKVCYVLTALLHWKDFSSETEWKKKKGLYGTHVHTHYCLITDHQTFYKHFCFEMMFGPAWLLLWNPHWSQCNRTIWLLHQTLLDTAGIVQQYLFLSSALLQTELTLLQLLNTGFAFRKHSNLSVVISCERQVECRAA